MSDRMIPDGNLTRTREMETTRWFGFKIDENWSWTDPSGHVHDKATLRDTTYQPTEELYCVDHGEVETRSVGDRRCRECNVEVKPKGMTGEWHEQRPLPFVWTVEYVAAGERQLWRDVPDALGLEIFEARQIRPFVDRLLAEVGQPAESEWSSL